MGKDSWCDGQLPGTIEKGRDELLISGTYRHGHLYLDVG